MSRLIGENMQLTLRAIKVDEQESKNADSQQYQNGDDDQQVLGWHSFVFAVPF